MGSLCHVRGKIMHVLSWQSVYALSRLLHWCFFPHCFTTQERKTKITLSWQHIQFPTPVHRLLHDEVIKWKHFPQYWPFVPGIHWSPVNSQHKGQWHRALMFSLICTWIHGWVNNREAGDLRCHRTHYDVTVMSLHIPTHPRFSQYFFLTKQSMLHTEMHRMLMIWFRYWWSE